MASQNRLKALCAPPPAPASHKAERAADSLDLSEFESEMKRLSAANQELLEQVQAVDDASREPASEAPSVVDSEELEYLRLENAELRVRIEELEALTAGQTEKLWRERQREYEMLLEEKSEVIRSLHQKLQEASESVNLADGPAPTPGLSNNSRTGQAQEILRLKRELEDQRKQLEQDEKDMMSQMRQMEMQFAKERAEMARQRQEVTRLQAELTREIENASRDPELKERLKGLRRSESMATIPTPGAEKPAKPAEQKSSGFFRRIFG
jgi:hypothetical protein